MPFANFKVPAGTLSAEQKSLIVHSSPDQFTEIEVAVDLIPWVSTGRFRGGWR